MIDSLKRYRELSKSDNSYLEDFIVYRDMNTVLREKNTKINDEDIDSLREVIIDFYNEDSKSNIPLSWVTKFITENFVDGNITLDDLNNSSYSEIYDAINYEEISMMKHEIER